MTEDYFLAIPLMCAVSIAWVISHHYQAEDIYTLKLIRRGSRIVEDRRDLLETITIAEAMTPFDRLTSIDVKTRLEEVLNYVYETKH